MNSNRMVLYATIVVLSLTFAGTLVFAAPTAPESLSFVQTGQRDLTQIGAKTTGAQGGNVTEINIQALTVTSSWQGYYGDISGEITLDDANNNTFYNWSMTTVQGEVYATRISSVDWTNVNCTNSTNVTSLGQTAADGDSVSNTFSLTTHPAFNAGSSQILADTCPSTFGYVNNATQSQNWSMVMLYDYSNNGQIYTSIINSTVVGFDGQTHDFQILVGENEKTGNEGSTLYYFWVELE